MISKLNVVLGTCGFFTLTLYGIVTFDRSAEKRAMFIQIDENEHMTLLIKGENSDGHDWTLLSGEGQSPNSRVILSNDQLRSFLEHIPSQDISFVDFTMTIPSELGVITFNYSSNCETGERYSIEGQIEHEGEKIFFKYNSLTGNMYFPRAIPDKRFAHLLTQYARGVDAEYRPLMDRAYLLKQLGDINEWSCIKELGAIA